MAADWHIQDIPQRVKFKNGGELGEEASEMTRKT
jgi:hypothetical protein